MCVDQFTYRLHPPRQLGQHQPPNHRPTLLNPLNLHLTTLHILPMIYTLTSSNQLTVAL